MEKRIKLIIDGCIEDLSILRALRKEKIVDEQAEKVCLNVMKELDSRYKTILSVLKQLSFVEEQDNLLFQEKKRKSKIIDMEIYRNPFNDFISEKTQRGSEFKVKPMDLYNAYVNWSLNVGIKYMGQHIFYNKITGKEIKAKRMRPQIAKGKQGSVVMFVGIGLK